jgi:hypothetical protein
MTSQRHSLVENRDILSRRSLIKAMGSGPLRRAPAVPWPRRPPSPQHGDESPA